MAARDEGPGNGSVACPFLPIFDPCDPWLSFLRRRRTGRTCGTGGTCRTVGTPGPPSPASRHVGLRVHVCTPYQFGRSSAVPFSSWFSLCLCAFVVAPLLRSCSFVSIRGYIPHDFLEWGPTSTSPSTAGRPTTVRPRTGGPGAREWQSLSSSGTSRCRRTSLLARRGGSVSACKRRPSGELVRRPRPRGEGRPDSETGAPGAGKRARLPRNVNGSALSS